jgi:hypothetical protein
VTNSQSLILCRQPRTANDESPISNSYSLVSSHFLSPSEGEGKGEGIIFINDLKGNKVRSSPVSGVKATFYAKATKEPETKRRGFPAQPKI